MIDFKVCITTRNREESFSKCYNSVLNFVDKKDIIIVDDASDEPYCDATYRFENRVGIPKAKNRCVYEFMKSKAQHCFLLDDDVTALHKDSFSRYIEAGIKHLCYTFYVGEKYGNLVKHALGNGCMMYFQRCCFDLVGGFDTRYGLGKFEHVDLSRRIHNIGITPERFLDVENSKELFYSLDEHKEIERTLPDTELTKEKFSYFHSKENSIEYIDYEE